MTAPNAPPRRLDATVAFRLFSANLWKKTATMTIKQRLDQLEKRDRRLTVALSMKVVAMCAVVTTAAYLIA